jgi:hypothetical protein
MLQTSMPELVLVPLNQHFAAAMYDLVQENRAHLTAHGDYTEHVAASLKHYMLSYAKVPVRTCGLQFC